eukprot:COSAG01_NODE_37669_length_500_cov_1.049875_2_plen_124_part_01
MEISEAAEFLFCRFQKFCEIRHFQSDRQCESSAHTPKICMGSNASHVTKSHREPLPDRIIARVQSLSTGPMDENGRAQGVLLRRSLGGLQQRLPPHVQRRLCGSVLALLDVVVRAVVPTVVAP